MSRPWRGALAAAALLGAAPAVAGECWQLSPDFAFCPEGGAWAGATLEQFGDGAVLHLGEVSLDFMASWAGYRRGDAAPPVDAALTALLARRADNEAPPVVLGRDIRRSGALEIALARLSDPQSFIGRPHLVLMVAGAEPGARLFLMLSATPQVPPEALAAQADAVIAGLRHAPDPTLGPTGD